MANIYSYDNDDWTYHNVTRVSDTSFTFHGVGAYAKTTIIGKDTGVFSSELFFRGNVNPSQGRTTEGLRCRMEFFSKQEPAQVHWDIEKHYIYIKGDVNGVINQSANTYSGLFGFYDHIDIYLEVLPDSELLVDDTIDLTSFVIDDPKLDPEIPLLKDMVERHELEISIHGIELREILGTEDEDGRLDIAEERVSELSANQLIFTETLAEGGVNLFDNPTYGGRQAPDRGYWHSGLTVGLVNARFEGMTIDEVLDVIGDLTIDEIFVYDW